LQGSRLRFHDSPRIGLALGGGFARGMAHVGVMRVLERNNIPIHAIAGVSAGSIAAAMYASGRTPAEIELIARTMRFRDVARWTISLLGLTRSERMEVFLARSLKVRRFEDMRIPLAVVASDLVTGKPVVFRGEGDVVVPIRASCSYPGLFQPIRHEGKCLVDGMVSMEVPAQPLRDMGCTHVISVAIPESMTCVDPRNAFSVITRSFQVLNGRTEQEWRRHSNVVIAPDVRSLAWDSFEQCEKLVQAGERAAEEAVPKILKWLPKPVATPLPASATA
jgi:NTE family protein